MTRVSPIDGHELWAPSYDSGPNPLLALESRILLALLGPVDGLSVVDIACGTGRWTERLFRLGANVTGVDACAGMLARAAAKRSIRRLLVLADARALPLRASIADLVICSFAIGYFARLGPAFAEMARITRPGGIVATSDLHPAAVSAGWTRSFRIGEAVYEIEHFARSRDQIIRAARRAGLQLQLQAGYRFGRPERSVFAAAGKRDRFTAACQVPAVWIGLWRKP